MLIANPPHRFVHDACQKNVADKCNAPDVKSAMREAAVERTFAMLGTNFCDEETLFKIPFEGEVSRARI